MIGSLSDSLLRLIAVTATWTGVFAAILAAVGGFVATVANSEKDRRADARSAQAEVRIADANKLAAQAGAVAATANNETARLAVRSAALEAEAANARLETEKLRATLTWRTIEPAGERAFLAATKKYKGQRYHLGTATEAESRQLMYSVHKLLQEAGWVWVKPTIIEETTADLVAGIYDVTGLSVALAPSKADALRPAATSLVAGLAKSGLSANIDTHPEFERDPGVVYIYIGRKPRPDLGP